MDNQAASGTALATDLRPIPTQAFLAVLKMQSHGEPFTAEQECKSELTDHLLSAAMTEGFFIFV